MHLAQALTATEVQNFFFDWYPIFGVVFMFGLLIVFVTLSPWLLTGLLLWGGFRLVRRRRAGGTAES